MLRLEIGRKNLKGYIAPETYQISFRIVVRTKICSSYKNSGRFYRNTLKLLMLPGVVTGELKLFGK